MRIVQITDTHISRLGGITTENLEKLIGLVNRINPTFVVHTGDVAILDPDDDEDRRAAASILEGIEAPLRVLPGNHDVGEGMGNAWAGLVTTPERLAAFSKVFGDDHWVEIVGDWAIVGINSEILGSGLEEEAAQWAWLETLPAQIGGRPTLLFQHKPVWNPYGVTDSEHNIAVPDAARERLLEIFADVDLKGVGSGHLHHFATSIRPTATGEALAVTGPATGFAGETAHLPGTGIAQQGIVEWTLEDGTVTARFRSVEDLVEVGPTAIPEFMVALAALVVTI